MLKIDWKQIWITKPWRDGTHFYYNMRPWKDGECYDSWESVWAVDGAIIHKLYAKGDPDVKKYQDLCE